MPIEVTKPRRFFLWVGLICIMAVVAGYYFIWGGASLLKDGQITIAEGTSARTVWEKMVADGYTRRTLPWRWWGYRLDLAGQMKAGKYQLAAGHSVKETVQKFIAGDVVSDEQFVTYPEGFTLQQVAERTAARGVGTATDFLKQSKASIFADRYEFLQDLPAERSLEGYLFPDTYQIAQDDQVADVITRLLTNFDNKVGQDLREDIKEHGRTLDEAVIMASLLEREATTTEDMKIIAGVLWKRADEDRGLDVDATIRYALHKWDTPLTAEDLAVDSPYNTRKYRGLPPGPISNPGLRALVAAANPVESDYYYYLTTADGETIFSKTNDEHNENKAKYLR